MRWRPFGIAFSGALFACDRVEGAPRSEAFAPTAPTTVPWTDHSGVVDVAITRGTRTERFALMIDTGAMGTSLSEAAFDRVFEPSAEVKMGRSMSASAWFQHDLGRVERLQFGDVDLANVVIASCPTCGQDGVDGLLGQNVLREVDMAWDADAATVSLHRAATTHDDARNVSPMLSARLGAVDRTGVRPVRVKNYSDLDVVDVLLDVRCGVDETELGPFALPAGERQRVGSLPARWDCDAWEWHVVGGSWDE